jgi:hypothetical protein
MSPLEKFSAIEEEESLAIATLLSLSPHLLLVVPLKAKESETSLA